MTRRRSRRYNRRRGFGRYADLRRGEDVNPMSYISNLSDAMLVLAMGIMVALVLHWNVNLSETNGSDEGTEEQVISFDEKELEDQEQLPEKAKKSGEVYYDAETDSYYIVRDGE